MGLSGWVLYLFAPVGAALILAITLSVLAIPRFIRGSQKEADWRIRREISQPIEPSERIAGYMIKNEVLYVETNEHPISMFGWYLGVTLLTAGVGALLFFTPFEDLKAWFVWVLLVFWGVSVVFVVCKSVLWQRNRLCISDKRIFVVVGYFKVRSEYLPLNKLAAGSTMTPWHGTILSWLRLVEAPYGMLKPDGAGEEDELKKRRLIPRVNQVSSLLRADR